MRFRAILRPIPWGTPEDIEGEAQSLDDLIQKLQIHHVNVRRIVYVEALRDGKMQRFGLAEIQSAINGGGES